MQCPCMYTCIYVCAYPCLCARVPVHAWMCLCVYMCVYLCMCAPVSLVCVYTYVSPCMCMCVGPCVCMDVSTCMDVRRCACVCMSMRGCMCPHVYARVSMCMRGHVCVYVCPYECAWMCLCLSPHVCTLPWTLFFLEPFGAEYPVLNILARFPGDRDTFLTSMSLPRLGKGLRHRWSIHTSPGSTDGEDSTPSSQKSSLSAQTVLTPLPAAEKCRKRRLPGGRLQAPVDRAWPSGPGESLSGLSSTAGSSRRDSSRSEASWPEEQEPRRSGSAREVSPKLQSAVPPGKQASLEMALLEALLDLVDRYWSGCKSLHGNEVFLAQARHILSSVEELTATQDSSTTVNEEISYLALENKSLQNRLADQQQQYSLKIHEVVSDLERARKEMDDLRQQLDRSSEENSGLKSLLFSMKKEAQNADSSAALSLQIPGLQTSLQRLSAEIGELKQHLEHYDKIQELTRMLQESHSSLVSTNEHLLRELGQARAQHRAEVEQLHWSYKELKKTMALSLSPQGSTRPGGC
ncbi:centrosomal protein of 72 kDa isoform X5 [Pteropus alecto]|uniref:centrosomal protein of 72 kDa isoform X5 n=1 Tax=Pteropus alecto TaxID=9402 RepID=UPI000D53966D|nr:centrosomal protein of 72 kDa isoform X5 [Pteropus alecto]